MQNSNTTRPKNGGARLKPFIKPLPHASTVQTRGAAQRAQRRVQDDAEKIISHYASSARKTLERTQHINNAAGKLKLTFLGGLESVGEKNMAVIEYGDQALILDCGNSLGVDLPGVNYEICDTAYLEKIKHKIIGYLITHGHLDHIGGLRHIVPKLPAIIYGSRYTIGVIERAFAEEPTSFVPQLVTVNADTHERLQLGVFGVEFIRVTHSVPDPTAICIETPVGRILATGDFRLDPEPLDHLPSDIERLKTLGDQGVLLLLSESSYADVEGRTPTEHTLQKSFHDIITDAPGRICIAVFSSNINRTQMIINAAVAVGRQIALDGRSMLGYVEIAVRQGILKVPKGAIVSMQQAERLPDDRLLVMCTGGQGEPNAALQRMSEGTHKHIQLKPSDTVVISSSPIPGNEVRYDEISNRLSQQGVRLFRHPTHELDGCGPLHVSGHARRDELREMIRLVRPAFLIPVHAGILRRRYHAELGIQEGMPRANILLPSNGDSLYFSKTSVEAGGQVPHGSVLVDQTGAVVSGLVVKDRLVLSQAGIMAVVLTISQTTGQLLASPDILSRGFVALRDSGQLMRDFRAELRRAVQQRFQRVEPERFKAELRDFITQYLFAQTGLSPIVIPVVNVVSRSAPAQPKTSSATSPTSARATSQNAHVAAAEQRFQAMRTRLLAQKSSHDHEPLVH